MWSRICAMVLALVCACATAAVDVQESCYVKNRIEPPRTTMQTIFLIDLTTPTPLQLFGAFGKMAITAASQPGQRVVLLTFAGESATEHVHAELDRTDEATLTDPLRTEPLPVRSYARSQACVKSAQLAWPGHIRGRLGPLLQSGTTPPFQRSEIVDALRHAIGDFAEDGVLTRIIVWSDGLEYDAGRISFYGPDRLPRRIDAQAELQKLPAEVLEPMAKLGEVQVLWWGLLIGDSPAGSAAAGAGGYFDMRTINELRRFWTVLLHRWGVQDVRIDRELLNAKLRQPRKDKDEGRTVPALNLIAGRSR